MENYRVQNKSKYALGNLIADEDRNEYVERYNLRFVNEERFGDKNVWVFHGKLEMEFQGKNIQMDYKLCILHPQNMIVHWEGSMGEDSLSYIVEDVGIFEGICYPRRGRFHQSQTMGLVDKIDYKFEVTDVRRYSSELLSNWFPEWPSGTSVQNIVTGKITRIPPSERQLAKVAKIQKDMLDSYAITPRSTTWLAFRIILVTIGIALILYAVYRMSEKRKKILSKTLCRPFDQLYCGLSSLLREWFPLALPLVNPPGWANWESADEIASITFVSVSDSRCLSTKLIDS